MKTWLKITLIIIAAIILAALVIEGIFVYNTEYRTRLVDESTSPDEQYKIILNQVGDPDFPFGPVKARVVLMRGEEKLETYDTEVWDDGAILSEFSWSVTWENDSVTVILRGSEQEPETILLKLAG